MLARGHHPWSLIAAVTLVGCAPSREPAQVPVVAVALPEPPPSPDHGLPVVPLDADWAPPRRIAGDLGQLRAALTEENAVRAVVEPRLASSAAVEAAAQELAPAAAWAVEPGTWASVVEPGPVPLQRAGAEGATAPRYAATGVVAQTPPTTTTLVLTEAPLELSAWRAMPAVSQGSCQPVFAALALSQEQSLAYAEPFLDHADTVLRLRFRDQLRGALPELQAQVEPFASPEASPDAGPEGAQAHACGHAHYQRVQQARACIDTDACAIGPRVVLRGGASVAMPAPPWRPDDCAQRLPFDVEATLTDLASAAAVDTVASLEPRWVTLVDRIGAMGAVHEALEDVCSPRRRRFAAEDLADARERLRSVERALASNTLDESGRWAVEPGALFVPGMGPMTTLATYRAGEGGASRVAVAEAKGVRRFLLSRSLCRSGYGERPLAAAVFEPGTTTPRYFGFVYEESLVCADLPVAP